MLGLGDHRAARRVGDLQRRQTPAERRARAPDQRHRRGPDRPLRGRRPRARPHPRPEDAPVTLVEYGDFECPYCGQAEPVVRELLSSSDDDVRYVWRHLPLNDVHGSAQLAAEAVEAANAQGAFWEMYDALLAHQDALNPQDITRIAQDLGLDLERFWAEIRRHEHARGSPRTSPAPTRAASRARPRSSSTAAATRAPTTSTRSAPPWRRRAGARG